MCTHNTHSIKYTWDFKNLQEKRERATKNEVGRQASKSEVTEEFTLYVCGAVAYVKRNVKISV